MPGHHRDQPAAAAKGPVAPSRSDDIRSRDIRPAPPWVASIGFDLSIMPCRASRAGASLQADERPKRPDPSTNEKARQPATVAGTRMASSASVPIRVDRERARGDLTVDLESGVSVRRSRRYRDGVEPGYKAGEA
jgi:hypothetical protein